MAFDRTSLIERVRVRLALHGYDVYDQALLYEVARRENQTLRTELESKNIDSESDAWLRTWCRAGTPLMALGCGVSLAQSKKALARMEHDGLVEVKPRGPAIPPLRRLSVDAFRLLGRGENGRPLYDRTKIDKKFRLGGLDWSTYLTEADFPDVQIMKPEEIDLCRARPKKIYFRSSYWRDIEYLKHATAYPEFSFDRASEKIRMDGKKPKHVRDRLYPFLLITHPTGTGPVHISGQPENPVAVDSPEDEEGEEA
jgi:hypothetical protein